MNFKRHSDATLTGMTKAELVEYIRMCEHNREVAEQTLAQHIENVKDWEPVRHGWWVPVCESEISGWNPEYAGYDPVGDYRCSLCGRDATLDCNNEFALSPYCPNCGAKMEGSKEDA